MVPPTASDSEHGIPNFNTEDEIKSMESKIKEFEFEQVGFTNDTSKCIDFWKTIRELPIKPATAWLALTDENESTEQSFVNEPNRECYNWCKALYELQKRSMDKVALATIGKLKLAKQCKYCKDIKDTVPKQKIPDDLTILNKLMDLKSTSDVQILPNLTETSFENDVRGHPIVGKVRTLASVYEPTVSFYTDHD